MRFIIGCAAMAIFFSARLHANPLIDQLIGATTDFLEQEVQQHIASSGLEARHEIRLSRLDQRLRLPLCADDAISAELESPATPVGRVTVRISCSAPSPWRLFVPAQVSLFQPVVVSTRPLSRRAVVSAQDVRLAERDTGLLGDNYLLDPAQAIGMQLKRNISADSVLSYTQLERNRIVQRGDKVVISSGNSNVSVKMPGEAMEDGTQGQQIRVRNTRSGRVIRARVTGPGQVEAGM
ncbi:flagellar basal body P-ring formation chaperone FlgA [Halopseudomonas maritima]|uniref:flagellar basal body P-ring formation chaperone FlgA n=1 Tax=Halopseudomonas maritima TaxID=2918528 RepID=UPI001EEA026D|nr:flagellar basal body P-ring formation chaperone FlgA [Halopseudomonas maritima]UJJ32149.1 flagellar basal body P-ring formation protein FlgA [Halopseudomonas maritima]